MAQEPELSASQVHEILATKPAPRVTEESIKAKIVDVSFTSHGTLTICIIKMENGWQSVGTSAPASPENFDLEVGKRYAYDNAFKPLWQLEGYLLRQELWLNETLEF